METFLGKDVTQESAEYLVIRYGVAREDVVEN